MKRGITASVLIITIVIMFLVISIATVVGIASVNNATYEEFNSKLSRVKDKVDMYLIKEGELPTSGTVVSKEGMDKNLLVSISNNGDDTNDLYIVDMEKINVFGVNIGYGDASDKDVFLVSKNTNNIYYYKGLAYKNTMYYTELDILLAELQDIVPPEIGTTETDVTAFTITITVVGASDDSGVKNYDFYLNGEKIVTQTSNEYTYTDLSGDTNYTIKYSVRDNYENFSTSEDQIIKTEVPIYTTVKGSNVYYIPYIPEGFYYVGGTWDTGLIISDSVLDLNSGEIAPSNGNQFVWVPVDGTNVTYAKWIDSYVLYRNTKDGSLPTGVASETTQITNYGGFYIARYTAGKVGTSTLVSKKGAPVWGDVSYNVAKTYAVRMYSTEEVKSGLVTGTQWDTTLKWIQNSGISITECKTWANYKNSISPANVSGYGTKQVTGYSEYWKVNNIYDLTGNATQWTNELHVNGDPIRRAGSYIDNGEDSPATYRAQQIHFTKHEARSFRVVLYII